jgi:hypothetical protein
VSWGLSEIPENKSSKALECSGKPPFSIFEVRKLVNLIIEMI